MTNIITVTDVYLQFYINFVLLNAWKIFMKKKKHSGNVVLNVGISICSSHSNSVLWLPGATQTWSTLALINPPLNGKKRHGNKLSFKVKDKNFAWSAEKDVSGVVVIYLLNTLEINLTVLAILNEKFLTCFEKTKVLLVWLQTIGSGFRVGVIVDQNGYVLASKNNYVVTCVTKVLLLSPGWWRNGYSML